MGFNTYLIEGFEVSPAQMGSAFGTLDVLHLVVTSCKMGHADFAHSVTQDKQHSTCLLCCLPHIPSLKPNSMLRQQARALTGESSQQLKRGEQQQNA